jgi:hypothetical protein
LAKGGRSIGACSTSQLERVNYFDPTPGYPQQATFLCLLQNTVSCLAGRAGQFRDVILGKRDDDALAWVTPKPRGIEETTKHSGLDGRVKSLEQGIRQSLHSMAKCADQDLIDRRLLSTEALEILLADGQCFRLLEGGHGGSATGVSVKKCEDTKEVSGSEQREHGRFAQGRRHADAEAATFDEMQGVPQISGVEDHFIFDETPSPGDGEETPAVLFWHPFEQRPLHRSDLDTSSQGLPDSRYTELAAPQKIAKRARDVTRNATVSNSFPSLPMHDSTL